MIKKILAVLLIALVVIQLFHPKRNKSEGDQLNYIGNSFSVPDDIKSILARSCNDCHSNNSNYPWYANVQPVAWWLNHHIKKGKSEINFDEFTNKSLRFQYHKFEEITEQVKEGKMPIKSYTWTHNDAVLSEADKNKLMAWADASRESMKSKYPMDSLVRKK
ncbi:MAG: heme-binding domain-containing protein [Chitinophagales bacterium]|nr:heme-binding domain-containing protein [Chitinophagales bacterium]